MKKSEKWLNVYFLGMFIILFLISYMFPYTHDDWAWGTSIGMDRLNSLFKNYNGRWVGNLLVMLLTRNRILRALFISISFVFIIKLITKISEGDKISSIFSIILLYGMPIPIMAQSIAWTSGYANYVPPIIISLFFILFNRNIFKNEEVNIKNRWIIPFLCLGFINSLFIEHVTIYNVLLSIFVVCYLLIKNKKLILANLFYMLGSIAGTILMFSNGAYHNIANSFDGYRTIEKGNFIKRAFNTYFNELYNYLINTNVFLNIILGVLVLILIYKFYKNNKSKVKDILIKVSIFIIIGFLSYTIYNKVIGGSNIFIYLSYKKYLEGIMTIAFIIAIVLVTIILIDKQKRFRILFDIISIIFIAAPLLIVSPIGPRCFFPTYILFILLTIEIFNIVIKNINIKKYLVTFSLFLCICTFSIYRYVYKVDEERINYINNHKNESILVLPEIPYTKYMQFPNPQVDVFKTRFKLFYNIDNNVELEFENYKKWKKREK